MIFTDPLLFLWLFSTACEAIHRPNLMISVSTIGSLYWSSVVSCPTRLFSTVCEAIHWPTVCDDIHWPTAISLTFLHCVWSYPLAHSLQLNRGPKSLQDFFGRQTGVSEGEGNKSLRFLGLANTPLATASLGLDSSLAGEARLKVEEQKNLQNIESEKYFYTIREVYFR